MNNHIQILSMNVRSLFSNTKKRSDVFNWFKAKKDVAVKWEDEWGSTFFFSHGDSKSARVSVMFRNGFAFKVNDSILDQNGRYIILDLTVYEHI